MLKNLGYKIAVLGCAASCLLSVAQAQNLEITSVSEDDDIIFTVEPVIQNMACDASGTGANARTFTWTVKNTTPANLQLYGIELTTNDANNFTGTLDDTTSTCVDGLIMSGYSTCDYVLDVTPPDCSSVAGPLAQTLDQTLTIRVYSLQDPPLQALVQSEVNFLGAAEDFAILVNDTNADVVNNDDGFGFAQVIGNFGAVISAGNINITDGVEYTPPFIADSIPAIAQLDMQSVQEMLIDQLTAGGGTNCVPHQLPDDGDVFTPGNYCLYGEDGNQDVVVEGTVTFSGKGHYVFFVDAGALSGCGTGPKDMFVRCNLQFNPLSDYTFTDGATPNNVSVVWVVGNGTAAESGNVIFQPDTNVFGTVITAGLIEARDTGYSPARIAGQLLSTAVPVSATDTVTLSGTSVTAD